MSTERSCPLPITTTSPPTATVFPIQTQTTSQPKAKYEEVVSDERVFMETLEDLHKAVGTKFMVPTIGGKPLDLHRLFVEVTSRGGLENVIRDRKWKDVIAGFTFPSTITSASFVLRKYYISLLQNYEQVYFFRNKDFKFSSDGVKPSNLSISSPPQLAVTSTECTIINQLPAPSDAKAISASKALQPQETTMSTQLKGTIEHQMPEHPPLGIGCWVKGKIGGKFESGYIVTANFGSETLSGVLYHVPLQPSEPQNLPFVISHCRGRKRSRREMSDPSRPKSNVSGYKIFFAEHYARLKPLYAGEERVITKQIGCLWNKLTESEKEVYQEKELRDRAIQE